MIVEADYVDLLVAHRPAKPRNRAELAEMTALLESLAANETPQSPAVERFIETLTALVMQYEEEIEPSPKVAPAELLQYLMEEHNLRQADLVPIFGSKSYVSQVLSGHRPISRAAAAKLAAHFRVAPHTFL